MPWDFWLIFLFLGVVIPWRGHVRLQRLLALASVGTKERLVLYGTTIAFQWILLGIVAWRCLARGVTPLALGLGGHVTGEFLFVSVGVGVLLGAFQWFNLRRLSRMSGPVPEFMRKLAVRIFPGSAVEFAPYCALCVTAGVCEEFLYRGFAMAALTRTGLSAWAVVLISSLLFGFAHTYQGKSGILGTTLLGSVFGIARLGFQSLLPVMVWHSAVDIAAGMAGSRYFARPVNRQ